MTIQIVRALRQICKAAPHVPMNLIPLSRAHVCVESTCEMVWHADEARRCPACGSDGVPLALRESPKAQAARRAVLLRAAARMAEEMEGGRL
jgi:hypothetical protein